MYVFFIFQPNEAGQKYLQMRREWKTDLSNIQPDEVTSNNCIFRFRTFHGLHRITVNLPDGSVLEQNVEISNNQGELVLVFNKQNSNEEIEPDWLILWDKCVGKNAVCSGDQVKSAVNLIS